MTFLALLSHSNLSDVIVAGLFMSGKNSSLNFPSDTYLSIRVKVQHICALLANLFTVQDTTHCKILNTVNRSNSLIMFQMFDTM